jgi:sugar phosphate isomerase/epimerase
VGYEGVELAITDPERLGPAERAGLVAALDEAGLAVAAITTGQAYGIEGISFTEEDEALRHRAIKRIKEHMRFVRELGLNAVVIIGLIRGTRGDAQGRRWLIEALKECAEFDGTVKLALEPLNRYETELIDNVDEALELLDRVEAGSVGILFDTFHANIEEASIEESIRKAGSHLFHIHVADSNRWPPGYGHLNFEEVGRALREGGYQGFGSLEALPKPSPQACLGKSAEFIRGL